VCFVGHPLADELPMRVDAGMARRDLGLAQRSTVLALLPGSRCGEVRLLAPLFLQAARLLIQRDPTLRFVLPAANEARAAEIRTLLAQQPDLPVTLVQGRSREVMAAADAVLLASGTATLEAALLKRPMVVAYRMAGFSWWLISRLVKTPFAALPNVLAGRALVPELLQDAAVPEAMAEQVQLLLGSAAAGQIDAFDEMHRHLRQDYARRSADALAALIRGECADG
jgi:lipid-A-disaccharide synthase